MQIKIIKLIIFIFILIINTEVLKSQNEKYIDSLEQNISEIIHNQQNDSILNLTFKEIFYYYESSQWGNSIDIANKALETYGKRNNKNLTSFWYRELGYLYYKHDVFTLSLEIYYKGLQLAKNNNQNKGKWYNSLAKVYLSQDIDINEAEKLILKAIAEQKLIENKYQKSKQLAYSYNQLGIVYERKKEFNKAIEIYKKAYRINKNINDTTGLVKSFFTIAYYYNFINKIDSSLIYYSKGLNLKKTTRYQILYFVNRALVYAKKGMFKKADSDIDSAMNIAINKSNSDISKVYKYKSQVENIKGETNNAIESALIAISEAEKYNKSKTKLELYKLLITYYKENSNYKKAQFYQEEYIDLLNVKEKEKYKTIQNNIISRENKKIDTLKIEKENLKNLNKKQYLLILFILTLFLATIVLFILFIRNKKKLANTSDEIYTQAIIAKILGNITGKQRSIDRFLQDSLDIILEVPWLKIETKGSIFLVNDEGNLKMFAEKNLSEALLKKCDIVKPGECLCGKTLKEGKTIFCDHISEKHDFRPKGMTPHGHYNIPFLFHGSVLGVLNLYLKEGHKKREHEIEFLEVISKTIASVIHRKKLQNESENQAKEQEKLNQQLFAQKLEVEQRNLEVEKLSKEQQKTNQKLFAQKLELEQRNIEIEKYSKEQDKLNQKFFAQTLELDQRNIEIKSYSNKLEKQKKQIEETHKNITDSINYAETIQAALLPKKELLSHVLGDYFVMFKPKQVVSGDFYFAAEIGNHSVFSVADATGHGVPGGFLTMLGITYIHDILNRKEVNTPADVLELLRKKIKGIFEDFGTKNSNGFDIAFCSINKKTNILTYSGAFNSLYIVRDGKLKEYRAVSNPIGWYPKEVAFKNIEIQLQNNDLIYLFSDGYSDQFGLKQRKFLKKRFKMLLLEIKDMSMEEQKNTLEGIFQKWKESEDQTDDVTVMGVRWGVTS